MDNKDSLFNNIKGFSIEMYETTKGIIMDYFKGIFEVIKEEICHTKFCTCINYIGSMLGIVLSILVCLLIFYYSIGMLFTFCMVGLGIILGFGLLWLWVHYIDLFTENRVVKIVTFPLILIVILGIVLFFKMILM